jgi:hypothetical protein
MQYRILSSMVAVFLAAGPLRADLTIRYKTSVTSGVALPPEDAAMLKEILAAAIPAECSIQIKRSKVRSQSGKLLTIVDYAKGEMTLLESESKRFATFPLSEYASRIGALIPDAAKVSLQQIKFDIKSEHTGRTAIIQNIPATETVITLSMEMPNPSGPPISVRTELHNWIATAEGLARVPALKEWSAQNWRSMGGWDPAEAMTAAFAQLPGAAQKMAAAMREASKEGTSLSLRTQNRFYMPFLAEMMKAQGIAVPDGPLAESTMEVAGFSSDPLPDSLFEVPADYQAAPFEDVIQASQAKPQLPTVLPRAPK